MIHSFLLIGQSNIAGRGFLEEAPEIDTTRLYTLRNGRWQKMFRPINPDRSTAGFNLAESFAEAYARDHDVNVGLICCADGGTTLEQWMPGSILYDNAVFHTKLAQRTSTLMGILWDQGASDCAEGRHKVYKDNLLKMLTCLRQDLGLPQIPILIGGMADFFPQCPRPSWELHNTPIIDEAQRAVAKALPNAAYVSAAGLTSNPDILHYCSASLYEFGLRYYGEFKNLQISSDAEAVPEESLERSDMEIL